MTTLLAALQERADREPDRVLLWFDGEAVTGGELWRSALRAAGGLSELGVASGDRVALFLANSPEFAAIWLGAMLLGAIGVPINLAYRDEFLRHQLVDSDAGVIVADADTIEAVSRIAGECSALRAVVVRKAASLPVIAGRDVLTTDTLLASEPTPCVDAATPEQPATVLYTSGTTGLSKGVVLSHAYLVRIGQAFANCSALTPDDTLFVPLPMFHISGLQALLTAILVGSRSVVEKRFSVTTAWDIVRRFDCTGMISVGPMLAMLMALPPDPRDAELPLRFLGTAPFPAPPDAIRARYGCEVQTMYGLTEAFPVAVARPGEAFPENSAGRCNDEAFEVRVVDEAGRTLPPGEPGEIAVREKIPHSMFEGYFRKPDATAERIRWGWFYTGDLGRLDADGFLYFLDRKKDALRRRGENISSLELENAIRRHPEVEDVAVHAVPSPLGEDEVKAVVVSRGAPPSGEELFAFFDEALPRFARPRYLEFVDELPRNPVGRVQKFLLRERGVTDTTLERT
ncbi:MAG: AMP-binding protein [Proteobacteria bacterium]|nr:AMP-binding protein [Pseudomonadota bacterium]